MKYSKYLLFIIPVVFLSACVTSSFESEEKRISISFEVSNLGTEIEIDGNIIEIEELKFPLEQINLYAADDVILQTRSDVTGLIFAYNEQMFEPRLIIEIGLGVSDVTEYLAYEMFLEPLSSRRNILDGDFFGSTQNYSIIIKGTVNGVDFDMRTTESFSKNFDLNNVELSLSNETLILDKTLNAAGVFVGDEQEFLDPNNRENYAKIAENIKQLLTVRASAGSVF